MSVMKVYLGRRIGMLVPTLAVIGLGGYSPKSE